MGVSTQVIESWRCDVCGCGATINASHANGHSDVDDWRHVGLEIPHYNIEKILICPRCVYTLKTKWCELNMSINKNRYSCDVLTPVLGAYTYLVEEVKKEKDEIKRDLVEGKGISGRKGS